MSYILLTLYAIFIVLFVKLIILSNCKTLEVAEKVNKRLTVIMNNICLFLFSFCTVECFFCLVHDFSIITLIGVLFSIYCLGDCIYSQVEQLADELKETNEKVEV